jgi:hypothetical protein
MIDNDTTLLVGSWYRSPRESLLTIIQQLQGLAAIAVYDARQASVPTMHLTC